MREGPSKIALVLVALFSPLVAFAQQGMPMGRDGMMWGTHGAGGTLLTVLVAFLLLAATAALLAFTFFLVQRSRPRGPVDT
jgi:uncharacterized membrane protein